MSTSSPARTAEQHRTATIALAVLGVFVTYLPITAVSVALTTIGAATGAGTADLQWISDAYVIPMAAMVLSAGVFGDVHGRRRVYLIGIVLTVLGALVAGLSATAEGSTAVHVLWAGQAVSGLGAGLLLPTTLALIAHAVPDPRARGKYVGIWATGMMAGLALGPIIAGSLIKITDWGWIYAPTASLAVLAGIAAATLLPESKSPDGRRLDWPGQISASIAIATSIFGIIEGGEKGWGSAQAVTGIVIGVIAFIAFLAIEHRSGAPLMNLSLFRSSGFSAAGLAALVALFSIVGAMFLLSLFLGYVQHLGPLEIGTRLLFVTGVGAVVNPVIGGLMHKVKAMNLLAAGLLLATVGVLLIGRIDETTGFADLAWRLAIFGIAIAIMFTSVSTAAINAVPWQLAGMGAAANTALRQYGGALGPAVLGVVFTSRVNGGASPADALQTALFVNAGLLALAAVACLFASWHSRTDAART